MGAPAGARAGRPRHPVHAAPHPVRHLPGRHDWQRGADRPRRRRRPGCRDRPDQNRFCDSHSGGHGVHGAPYCATQVPAGGLPDRVCRVRGGLGAGAQQLLSLSDAGGAGECGEPAPAVAAPRGDRRGLPHGDGQRGPGGPARGPDGGVAQPGGRRPPDGHRRDAGAQRRELASGTSRGQSRAGALTGASGGARPRGEPGRYRRRAARLRGARPDHDHRPVRGAGRWRRPGDR